MSKSVVPAAAAAHAKRLVSNKKLAAQHEAQQPAQDEPRAVDHKDEAANVVHQNAAQPQQLSMSDATLGGFSFAGALSDAAASTASLTVATSAQDEGGYSDDDSDGSGTILLVGAVALVGAGIAVLAGGGGKGNEAPTITSGATATAIAENTAATTVVYTATATDPDGDALTYSLSGADAAAFNINATTGAVTLKAPSDFETKSSYAFNVVASDGELSATKAVTLAITNVSEAPVFTSGATATVAENSATTTVVYDAAVTGSGATFALTGADADAFNIDPATGVVTFKASPNFEAQSSYAIGVVATQDGMTTTQNIAVSVTDVVEPGPSFTSNGDATVAENAPISTVVYDADATGTGDITFALTGADAALFNIDATTGEVTLKNSADFETKDSYDFNVTATDDNGTSSQAVTLAITDVDPEDAFTTVSLDDLPGMTLNTAATVDASGGAFVYTDDAAETTNVIITGFGEDDVIQIDGLPDPSGNVTNPLNFLSYTTSGTNDLRIDWQNTATGTVEFFIIEDVVADNSVIFNYQTAMNAVGFDFLTIA